MKDLKYLLVLITLLIFSSSLCAGIVFFGYFENRLFIIDNRTCSWDDFNNKFKLGDYNRLRLIMNAKPDNNIAIHLAVDLFSFHGLISSPFGTREETNLTDAVKIIPDRLYADLHFKTFDLSIGRQRIPIGVSYLWAPLDVFGRVNFFEPKEEKPGVNAFKLYFPLGSSSSISGVFSLDESLKTSKSAIRAQTSLAGIDGALTIINRGDTESTIYGLDLRGENLIGWWFEMALSRGMMYSDRIVLGFDATFPIGSGLYWLNEFYYDSSGSAQASAYKFDLLSSGDRFTLGKCYLMSMLRLKPSELWSVSMTYIGNFNDGSLLLSPSMSLDLSQNLLLSTGLYLPFGADNSEFGRYQITVFYLWLKFNF